MKTAGLVLDFYDDRGGTLLKQAFPTVEELPEIIKEAHILSPDERQVLRDEAYALVLRDDDGTKRKFACVDPGNTALSALYFLQNAEKLPAEAIKTAAQNIASFMQDFGMEIPTELKLAMETGLPVLDKTAANPMARKRDSMKQPFVGDEADWAQRTNLVSVRGGADSGRVIPTANQMKTAQVEKVWNWVDVSKLSPTPPAVKTAGVPIDGYDQVEYAVRSFSETWTEMPAQSRHEYAVKLAARAEELGIKMPYALERYGSTEYAPDVEAHLASRRVARPEHARLYQDLQEKRAMIDPETFAGLLQAADEAVGLNWYWGGQVQDPWFSTFGGKGQEKIASATEDGITADQLSAIPRDQLTKNFAPDFCQAFELDPVLIYNSMPMDTKQVIARMARGE